MYFCVNFNENFIFFTMKTQKITVQIDLELEKDGKPIFQQLHDQYSGLAASIKESICQKMGWASDGPYNKRIKGETTLSPVEMAVFIDAFGVPDTLINQYQNQSI